MPQERICGELPQEFLDQLFWTLKFSCSVQKCQNRVLSRAGIAVGRYPSRSPIGSACGAWGRTTMPRPAPSVPEGVPQAGNEAPGGVAEEGPMPVRIQWDIPRSVTQTLIVQVEVVVFNIR